MAKPRTSRPTARDQRKSASKRADHGPLLRLVDELEALRQPAIKGRAEPVKPLTDNQRLYDALIRGNDLVFGLGCAGTGKTWFAVQRACEAFKAGRVGKIIATRPMVTAGEGPGYLPGTLDEKFAPYFQPVRDALDEGLGSTHVDYLIAHGKIVIKPLEFIRGSTLKDAWVIADEMQNATVTQMKMFLTRIGEPAKFIVNGDSDQIDLPSPAASGLEDAVRRLAGVASVGVVRFGVGDIVRSGLCSDIVRAYARPSASPRASVYNDADENDSNEAGLRSLLKSS